MASHDAQGYVLPDAGNADLYVELDRLVVDEPALRAEAHFDTQPSPEDIAGTRRNMLGSGVLDAARYPFARVHVAGVSGTGDARAASVSITLHGMTRAMQVPLRIETSADEMTVSGQLTLRQTDFGIAPLSVLGGAIQVKDAVDLQLPAACAAARMTAQPSPRAAIIVMIDPASEKMSIAVVPSTPAWTQR